MFERFLRRANDRRATASVVSPPLVPDFLLARSIADVIEILRLSAREIAHADGVTVVTRRGDEVEYVGEDAIAPLWTGQRFPIRSCVTGLALLSGTPIVIPDIRSDARVPLHLYLSTFVRSMAVFPIGRSDPTHALGVYWRNSGPADPSALDRIAALSRAAGDAITGIAAIDSERAA